MIRRYYLDGEEVPRSELVREVGDSDTTRTGPHEDVCPGDGCWWCGYVARSRALLGGARG